MEITIILDELFIHLQARSSLAMVHLITSQYIQILDIYLLLKEGNEWILTEK